MYGNILTGRPWGDKSPFMPSGAVQTSDRNPYGQIGDTVVLSPTMVLDIRYGVNRTNAINIGGSQGTFTAADYENFGIPKTVQSVMAIYGSAPDITPASYGGAGAAWSALNSASSLNKHEWQLNHSVTGSITKTHGKWTHKFGGEFRNMMAVWQDPQIAAASLPAEYGSSGGSYTF
jgi:hypothetical protein